AFANGFKHRPDTTFGTVNADVLVDIDPSFKPLNFVEIIRTSPWVS
ncbi:MAG: phosphohydrolase, partial [Pseudomonas helleri]